MDEYETLLTENRIWIGRTKGIGIISAEDAIAIGRQGPVIRASGVEVGHSQVRAVRRLRSIRVRYSDREKRRHV